MAEPSPIPAARPEPSLQAPDERGLHVLVRNDAGETRSLSVSLARGDRRRVRAVELPAGAARPIPAPDGDGPVTAEVHADGTGAAVTVDPDGRPPLLCLREDSVLVASG